MAATRLENPLSHPRAAPRYKVFEPASIECRGRRARAHILDLSAQGARLHCLEPLAIGGWVDLQCDHFRTSGRIVWGRERRFGVEFNSPLPDAYLRRVIDGDRG